MESSSNDLSKDLELDSKFDQIEISTLKLKTNIEETKPFSKPHRKKYLQQGQNPYNDYKASNKVDKEFKNVLQILNCKDDSNQINERPQQKKVQTDLNDIRNSSAGKYDSLARQNPKRILPIVKVLPKETQEKKETKETQEIKETKETKLDEIKKKVLGDITPKEQNVIIRKNEFTMAKQTLQGKLFIIWIFVFRQKLEQKIEGRIQKMYQGIEAGNKNNIVPRCKYHQDSGPFLEIPNCYFKIVTDLNNAQQVLKFKINPRVVQFYIYNNQGQNGMSKALKIKSKSRKVKEIFVDFQNILTRAQQQIRNEIDLYQFKNLNIETIKLNKKFPSFLRMIGEEKTKAILYRSNLYGALKISPKEKRQYYQKFMELVNEQYKDQKDNISQYSKMDHFNKTYSVAQAKPVIQFYVRESFYYKILNSMLRTMKTTAQFESCILPFNETYHSLRMLYKEQNMIQIDGSRRLKKNQFFRGAMLRRKDFENLEVGLFIQMFGFMSTSKNINKAVQFTVKEDNKDYYIFVIHVPQISIPKQYDNYDHGFVDINKLEISNKNSDQQQVLFNALNVYRVKQKQIKKINSVEFSVIHLEYGVIFQLASKPSLSLRPEESDALVNYQYCTKMQNEIEDQGDVHLIANEHEQCKQYYQNKLKQNQEDFVAHVKIANVFQCLGQLQSAEDHINIALKVADVNDREIALKVFSCHAKNAEIQLDKENYVQAEKETLQMYQNAPSQNCQAVALRKLGQIKFKAGDIREAQNRLHQAVYIYQKQLKQFQQQRRRIEQQNGLTFFQWIALMCQDNQVSQQRQIQLNKKLQKIKELERKHSLMKKQIEDEQIKLNNSLKQVAHYAENALQYKKCVEKGRSLVAHMQSQKTNDVRMKAHYRFMEATVRSYQKLADVEKLLYQAIQLVQKTEPNDIQVAEYSQKLASLQQLQLEYQMNLKNKLGQEEQADDKIVYNEVQHQQIYQRCKKNYQKAINVLLYNNKVQGSKQIASLRNKLSQLEFNEKNFKESEKVLLECIGYKAVHIEMARSHYILSKIAISRGQLKCAFQYIIKADNVLREVLVKQQTSEFIIIFEHHKRHLDNIFQKSKIYQKQLKLDQSLKQLNLIENNIKDQFDENSHSLFAAIYEQYGAIAVAKGQIQHFDNHFKRAIQIQTKQIGENAIPNGVSYCNYAKHLLMTNDISLAQKQIQKALVIFARLNPDHPLYWLFVFTKALYYDKKNQFDQASIFFERSLKLAKQRYGKQHISLSKIKFKYGKNLMNSNLQKSIRQLEQLDINLSNEIRQSSKRKQIQTEIDDEKISIAKNTLGTLKTAYQKLRLNGKAQNCSLRMTDLMTAYQINPPSIP